MVDVGDETTSDWATVDGISELQDLEKNSWHLERPSHLLYPAIQSYDVQLWLKHVVPLTLHILQFLSIPCLKRHLRSGEHHRWARTASVWQQALTDTPRAVVKMDPPETSLV